MIIPPKENCNALYNHIDKYTNHNVIFEEDRIYVVNKTTGNKTPISFKCEWLDFYKQLIEN